MGQRPSKDNFSMSENPLKPQNNAVSQAQKPSLPARGPPVGRSDLAVVGIGASAGGLEACIGLVAALPADTGMAFILVQHLDPTHKSLMAELLSGHTKMVVVQAADKMPLEADRLYIIPPGSYLSVQKRHLRLSPPQARRGARLPFDFLLRSLATAAGERAMCVILSGNGADGSLGLKAVKERGGLVIAQQPEEATFDGMPRSAIETGAVDLVLPVADIPEALIRFERRMAAAPSDGASVPEGDGGTEREQTLLQAIIKLLREKTDQDFTLYKTGTLKRRIERRMGMAAIDTGDMNRYLEMLQTDMTELHQLAQDLLINVTSFFRDSNVFALLEKHTIPDLIRRQTPDQPLRIWVAGCSTGQETYSLAMLFVEQLERLKSHVKLQVFASDVDPDAVAAAREGYYPPSLETEISPSRLARFFVKNDQGYRVQPSLRGLIVFTVQDVLADPPFSRLDMISCRNLLIYLQPEAQARVIGLFHFALRDGGLLLLGNAETVTDNEGRFQPVAKAERLYCRIGRSRAGAVGVPSSAVEGLKIRGGTGHGPAYPRQTKFADLGRRLILECFAPAAVLINQTDECLYTLGPTDAFLRIAPGHHTNNLLALARPGMRAKLKSAIEQSRHAKARIVVNGGSLRHNNHSLSFRIDVQPVSSEGEELLLVCFIEEANFQQSADPPIEASLQNPPPGQDISDLRLELETTRAELRNALRDLETSTEEQKAINEEALSVNEEFQSTNEELLTSKEELQSLNEELTALNSQLQETLERQRVTSDDLQNVLFSTDVAILFLDVDLKIRFFTPASRALFNIIASDVGRPLADLHSLASDGALAADAKTVLETLEPMEREIEAPGSVWFMRRILPYRAHGARVEGVVITFVDITERKDTAKTVELARQEAEQANLAKTRFLAAASHDLRQPLQTLTLLHGLLVKSAESEKAKKLIERQGETLAAMSGMLNTLLDINQIEAGIILPNVVRFTVNEILLRIQSEFSYLAQAQDLTLHVVPCSLVVESDPLLLEQMVRNLLSNALKYTRRGGILLGCRRRAGFVSLEVWDTGIGIPATELQAIFQEYHQLDNTARERNRGLGLGLSIVQRLAKLLGHQVRVQSHKGKGSVFAIDILRPESKPNAPPEPQSTDVAEQGAKVSQRTGVILVVEDDPDVREVLQLFLQDEGHFAGTTRDGNAALELMSRGVIRPDLILADYNLPGGLNGLQLALRLRESAGATVPVVILTGDISTQTIRKVAEHNFLHLTKPVRLEELRAVIQRLLPSSRFGSPGRLRDQARAASPDEATATPRVSVVDDDATLCHATRAVLEDSGFDVETYTSGEAFLDAFRPSGVQCVLVDAYLPGMSGLTLLQRLRDTGHHVTSILITGQSDVPLAVQAMKAGASDFIEKPISRPDLLASISRAMELALDANKRVAWQEDAADHIAGLTARQRQIMTLVLAGQPSKNIAADLSISQRTVENHRASIMRKTGAKSLPALARLAVAAAYSEI
jgi:two-component system CheB/CheR fusion protein